MVLKNFPNQYAPLPASRGCPTQAIQKSKAKAVLALVRAVAPGFELAATAKTQASAALLPNRRSESACRLDCFGGCSKQSAWFPSTQRTVQSPGLTRSSLQSRVPRAIVPATWCSKNSTKSAIGDRRYRHQACYPLRPSATAPKPTEFRRHPSPRSASPFPALAAPVASGASKPYWFAVW